ncbi:MAG: NYN domain-containing protein, partial [bacterium]|nr:NYN domain-containing protein [bacterium]
MRRFPQDDYKKLVPLKRIAEASSYSFGYVSILVQRKKLKAKKIGNKYFTTKEWFDQYLELHARDEKMLAPEAVNELSGNNPPTPLWKGGASQSVAGETLKNRIDDLVERAIKAKLKAEHPAEKMAVKKRGSTSSLEVEPQESPVEVKNLAEVLEEKIQAAPARLIADLKEPEKKLAGEWLNQVRREERELKKAVKEIAKEAKAEIAAEKKVESSSEVKKNSLKVKSRVREIASVASARWRSSLAMTVRSGAKILGRKIKSPLPPLLKGAVRPAFACAVISLAGFFLVHFAPDAGVNLSAMAKRTFSHALSPLKELAGKPNIIIPGSETAAGAKSVWDQTLLSLADRASAASLKLENNLRQRNRVLARRLGAVKNQLSFIGGFWQEGFFDAYIKSPLPPFVKGGVQAGQDSLAMLKSFVTPTEVGQNEKITPTEVGQNNLETGRVAGASDSAVSAPAPFGRLIALANTTARRGQEVINQVKYSAGSALANSADSQRGLSLALGQKLASLTLASAQGASLVSQSGSRQLARLENAISQTNQTIKQSGQTGQSYLAREAGRSLLSLFSLYSRAVDFLVPVSLKTKYAKLYEQPSAPQTQTVIEKQTVVKETTQITPAKAGQKEITPAKAGQKLVKSPLPPLLKGAEKNLSITGNADIGGELNVSGPVRLKARLTVAGASEFLGDMMVNAGLTAKSLLVTDYAQFAGPINAKVITADSLTSRNDLTVVGNSFVGGNELISGNLKVAGTFQAGHTEFSSLGVTGSVGAQALSAGAGGLSVNGNTYLSGPVDLNEILDIDAKSGAALTVGDGTTDYFTVGTTGGGTVTISAALNLSGNTLFNGNLDLNGALDLDTASTSALTAGDGVNDNFIIDTVNDIAALGYSSTTDQLNFNAQQIAINSASTTTAMLINYDGTGNVVQILDNGVNRFNLADNGNIIQTASTTGYAYVLNQAGANGSLLDVQDQGTDRFTIADLGVTSLTASSTAGTALSVRQNDTGDILNLFDGSTEVLTVLDGGNVGIGTTSPAAKLQIAGNTEQLRLGYDGQNYTAITVSADGAIELAPTNSATTTIANAFQAASSLYVLNNGNLGLGTLSPAQKFQINDTAEAAFVVTSAGNVGLGTTSPAANLTLRQVNNGDAMILGVRRTDTAPSGDFIDFTSLSGTTLFRVDNSGNLLAGGVVNSGSQTITSTSQPQFRAQYDAADEVTLSVGSTGTSTLAINGASPSLTFVPQSNSANTFNFTDAASNSILSIDTQNQRVGIGTTSPLATLSVQGAAGNNIFNVASSTGQNLLTVTNTGQCVTGDTKLRRRRRRKNKGDADDDEEYEWEDVEIKDIQPGDEILTMDERTGKLVVSRVNALMDMGVKPIYKITTASGKTIRTTENHPYYINAEAAPVRLKQSSTVFEVDQSNRIEELNKDSFIALANQELAFTAKLSAKEKKPLYERHLLKRSHRKFGWLEFAKVIKILAGMSGFRVTDLIIDFEYPSYEGLIAGWFKQYLPEVSVVFKQIGKSSPAHAAAWQAQRRRSPIQAIIQFEQIKNAETPRGAIELLHYGVDTVDSQPTRQNQFYNSIIKKFVKSGSWTKVKYLKVNQEIAVSDEKSGYSVWDKIIKIELLPAEQVYDIEVEGTHNFVGNGIIAHNTYIYGNLGIASSSPFVKLGLEGDAYFHGNATTTGAFNVGGALTVTGNTTFSGNLLPSSDNQYDLGTSTARWRDLYLGPGSLRIYNTNDANAEYLTLGYSSNVATLNLTRDAAGNYRPFAINQNGGEVMRITGGNVGIGTSSPYAKLSVAGRGVFDQDIRFDYFTATSTTATSTLAGGLAIKTNGLVYDWQTDNVGINTASPSYKLDVNGTVRAVDNAFFNSNVTLGDATTTDVVYLNARIGGHLIPTADNVLDLGDATNWLRWRTGYFGTSVGIAGLATSTGTSLLANGAYTIDSAGTLSINTTNNQSVTFGLGNVILPYASSTALTVSGLASTTDIYVSNNAYLSPMTSGSIFFAGTNGLISQNNSNLNWNNSTNLLTVLGNATTTQLTATGSAYFATIGGNVGIGTTSPYSLLSISNNLNTTANTPLFTIASTTAGTATSTLLTVLANGNVGIGVANPKGTLFVSSPDSAIYSDWSTGGATSGGTIGLFSNANSGGIISNWYYNVGDATNRYARNGGVSKIYLDVTSGATAGDIVFSSAASGAADASFNFSERMRLTQAGNLGIGTTSPAGLLNVASTLPRLYLSDTDFATNGHWFMENNAGVFSLGTTSSALAVSNTRALSITNTGNVGIGTTDPRGWLQLQKTGSGNVSDIMFTVDSGSGGVAVYDAGYSPTYAQFIDRMSIYTGTTGAINGALGGLDLRADDTNADIRFYTGGYLTSNERMRITSTGNVGIGTTTPTSLLQVSGATPKFYLSNTSGGVDGKHWFMSNASGDFSLGTTSDSLATNSTFLTVKGNTGNVGIGTTSPLAKFSVQGAAGNNIFDVASSTGQSLLTVNNTGQCVTGDTKLRRRRRKKKGDGEADEEEDEWEDVEIKDIMPGDEILTMDEHTGKLVVSRVNALMDMGVKPIYKITTASGKSIRTTGNHPYLVKTDKREIDINRIAEASAMPNAIWTKAAGLLPGDEIAAAKTDKKIGIFIDDANLFYGYKRYGWRVDLLKFKQLLAKDFAIETINYYMTMPDKKDLAYYNSAKHADKIKSLGINTIVKPLKYIFDQDHGQYIKKGNIDVDITRDIIKNLDKYDIVFILSGDSDYAALADIIQRAGKKVVFVGYEKNMAWELRQKYHIYFEKIKDLITTENKKAPLKFLAESNGVTLLSVLYGKLGIVSSGQEESDKKAEAEFEKITKIELLPAEQVYDIEVEGTHNFVGNGIIAHNTYIYGNLGIASSSPFVKLGLEGDAYFHGNATTTGAFNVGGSLTVTGNTTFSGNLIPASDNQYDLGTSTARWRDLYLGPGSLRIYNTNDANAEYLTLGYSSNVATLNLTRDAAGTYRPFAINQNGSEVMRITNGNVGIGTTSPATRLTVAGDNSPYVTILSGQQGITNGTDLGGMFWRVADDSGGSVIENAGKIMLEGDVGTWDGSAGTDNSRMSFYTMKARALTEWMRITSQGNVGIGTSSPLSKLSLYNAGADSGLAFGDTNTTRFTIGTDYSDSSKFKFSASVALGTNDRLTITTDGNVGIGTT